MRKRPCLTMAEESSRAGAKQALLSAINEHRKVAQLPPLLSVYVPSRGHTHALDTPGLLAGAARAV